MRLMSFVYAAESTSRFGVIVDDSVIDLVEAARELAYPERSMPSNLTAFAAAGESVLATATEIMDRFRELSDDSSQVNFSWVYPVSGVRFLPPLLNPPKVIAVGRNYRDHIGEVGGTPPDMPKLFAKFACNMVGHQSPIIKPRMTDCVDWEGEMVIVIGRGGRDIPESRALEHVFGYTAANDLSARDIQFHDQQLTLAKNFRTFLPIGPHVVTRDEVTDPNALGLRLWVDEKLMQDSNTNCLIYNSQYLVSFISSVMDLEAGDLILTGTPSGVGYAQDPPCYLFPGQSVRIEVEGLGTLENHVVSDDWVDESPSAHSGIQQAAG